MLNLGLSAPLLVESFRAYTLGQCRLVVTAQIDKNYDNRVHILIAWSNLAATGGDSSSGWAHMQQKFVSGWQQNSSWQCKQSVLSMKNIRLSLTGSYDVRIKLLWPNTKNIQKNRAFVKRLQQRYLCTNLAPIDTVELCSGVVPTLKRKSSLFE